jgi:hypothetical protein
MHTPNPLPEATVELLASAQRSLCLATVSTRPGERYAAAHLAALRAAAALVALYGKPRSRQVRSVWHLLARLAPEFGEWAAFFASGAQKRAAAEAGLPSVTSREADDLIRDAERFLDCIRQRLGVPQQLLAIG